jgi:multisubunit Na+/H+ antiporter MnhE subunit
LQLYGSAVMKNPFPHPIYTFFLALGWMILRQGYGVGDFLVGYVIAALVVYIHRNFFLQSVRIRKPFQWFKMLLVFAREVIIANIQVAWIVMRPRLKLQPAAIRLPIDLRDDVSITALANMITLTPGTWTIDVAPDRSALYVHCLSAPDVEAVKRQIKQQFEARLKATIEVAAVVEE